MAKAKMPPITRAQLDVLLAVSSWYEAQTVQIKGATCSGPERFWMAERVRTKDALLKAYAALAKAEPANFGSQEIRNAIRRSLDRNIAR